MQQYAEAHRLKFQTIRADQEEELSVEEVLDITTNWKDNIIHGLKMDDVLWHEDYQTTPYYTNKPDWDALNALLLYISENIQIKYQKLLKEISIFMNILLLKNF